MYTSSSENATPVSASAAHNNTISRLFMSFLPYLPKSGFARSFNMIPQSAPFVYKGNALRHGSRMKREPVGQNLRNFRARSARATARFSNFQFENPRFPAKSVPAIIVGELRPSKPPGVSFLLSLSHNFNHAFTLRAALRNAPLRRSGASLRSSSLLQYPRQYGRTIP